MVTEVSQQVLKRLHYNWDFINKIENKIQNFIKKTNNVKNEKRNQKNKQN